MPAKEILSKCLPVILICAAALWLALACGENPCGEISTLKEPDMTTPELYEADVERARAIRDKYYPLFLRQPNVVGVGIGIIYDARGEYTDRAGFSIRVTKAVDQSTLPPERRIPDCLEEVPVQILEVPDDPSYHGLPLDGKKLWQRSLRRNGRREQMGEIRSRHRPLLAGIGIKAANGSYGTLTGMATRNSDGKPVLVTNLHIINREWTVSGDESIYQWDVNDANKVGHLYTEDGPDGSRDSWVPVERGLLQNNIADVAALELYDDVGAEFALHNHPMHDNRQVIPGVIEPRVGMKLMMLGATSGERTVTVAHTDQIVLVWGTTFTGASILHGDRILSSPVQGGDSGAPCIYQEDDNCYRMCCIAFGEWHLRDIGLNVGEGFAFPASVAERELGITFGYPYEIKTRSEENMGEPILTSEGFAGRRIIIDDYFQAGETLYAGDVVAIQQASIDRGSHPRIFRIAGDADVRRVIGVVHTPAGKEVGDQMATTGATPASLSWNLRGRPSTSQPTFRWQPPAHLASSM